MLGTHWPPLEALPCLRGEKRTWSLELGCLAWPHFGDNLGRALIPRLRGLCEDLHASNQGSSPFLLLSCGQAQGLHGEGPGPQEQGCCMVLGRKGDPGDPGDAC